MARKKFYLSNSGDNTDGLTWATAYSDNESLASNEQTYTDGRINNQVIIFVDHGYSDNLFDRFSLLHATSGHYYSVRYISVDPIDDSYSSGAKFIFPAGSQTDILADGADVMGVDFESADPTAGILHLGSQENNGPTTFQDMTIKSGQISLEGNSFARFKDIIIDLSASTANLYTMFSCGSQAESVLDNVSFLTNPANLPHRDIITTGQHQTVKNCDWSNLPDGLSLSFYAANIGYHLFENIKTAATFQFWYQTAYGSLWTKWHGIYKNCGPTYDPDQFCYVRGWGAYYSSKTILRQGSLLSWLITSLTIWDETIAASDLAMGVYTTRSPDIYFKANGSKTITLYLTNDLRNIKD